MLIAIVDSEAVVQIADYRALFPNVSFPPSGPEAKWLADNSCMPVNLFKPHNRATQKLVPADPYIEGEWVYTIAVEDKTEEELVAEREAQWSNVRADRNKRLADCDWTQLPDAPVDATAWAAYRQALRDMTDQPDPFNITWPKEP